MECAQLHVLRSSVVVLEHWLCTLDAGALDLGLLGLSAVRTIAPSAFERTGRDQMCILANSTL
jgi:hypothetical protein